MFFVAWLSGFSAGETSFANDLDVLTLIRIESLEQ